MSVARNVHFRIPSQSYVHAIDQEIRGQSLPVQRRSATGCPLAHTPSSSFYPDQARADDQGGAEDSIEAQHHLRQQRRGHRQREHERRWHAQKGPAESLLVKIFKGSAVKIFKGSASTLGRPKRIPRLIYSTKR